MQIVDSPNTIPVQIPQHRTTYITVLLLYRTVPYSTVFRWNYSTDSVIPVPVCKFVDDGAVLAPRHTVLNARYQLSGPD